MEDQQMNVNPAPATGPSMDSSMKPDMGSRKMGMKSLSKNKIIIGITVLVIIIAGILVYANTVTNNPLSALKLNFGMNREELAKTSVDYINKNLLTDGQTAVLKSVSEESGLVKMSIEITASGQTNTYDSYVTKDGKLLFPSAISLDTVIHTTTK
jgi:hypothetical protein